MFAGRPTANSEEVQVLDDDSVVPTVVGCAVALLFALYLSGNLREDPWGWVPVILGIVVAVAVVARMEDQRRR